MTSNLASPKCKFVLRKQYKLVLSVFNLCLRKETGEENLQKGKLRKTRAQCMGLVTFRPIEAYTWHTKQR